MITYLKNLLTSFLLWLRPPKIGHIDIEVTESPLTQDVRVQQDSLEVDLNDWKEFIDDVFNSDNFVTEGINRPNRPSDEVLKKQIQLFFKDYRNFNKKVDQLYTKTIKIKNMEE